MRTRTNSGNRVARCWRVTTVLKAAQAPLDDGRALFLERAPLSCKRWLRFAGDSLVLYGASKADSQAGRVESFTRRCRNVGHLDGGDVGEIGLQDIRECLVAHRRADGEFIVFLEDDYKSKVVMYRLAPSSLK